MSCCYSRIQANLQVNIPAVQRKQITESIVGCASNNAPNRYLFQKAQAEVFKMMKMDSFVMFQKSREVSYPVNAILDLRSVTLSVLLCTVVCRHDQLCEREMSCRALVLEGVR